MRRVLFLAMGVFLAAGVAAQTLPPALVVALDSSRSLEASDLRQVVDALEVGLEAGRNPAVPAGLVTFDDAARWVIEPTGDHARFLAALGAIEPAGTTTVLLDGIYLAVREMPEGSVVLVISDGQDENSAVTFEDVTTLCGRKGVGLLTAGVGRNVDDRFLRRLAMVTGGEYLGARFDGIGAILGEAVSRLMPRPEAAADTVPVGDHATPPTAGAALDGATGEPPAGGPEPGRLRGFGLAVLVGAMVIGVVAALWWFFFRPAVPPCCTKCGHPLSEADEDCPECRLERIRAAAESEDIAPSPDEPGDEPRRFETHSGQLEPTVILGELATLTVREKGCPPRFYPLPKDRIFAIGRGSKANTLQVKDQTISTQHFKIVFKEGHYYVVDLWTTNGTSVNHEYVRVHCLQSGDVIRAGMTEFLFEIKAPTSGSGTAVRTAPPPLRK